MFFEMICEHEFRCKAFKKKQDIYYLTMYLNRTNSFVWVWGSKFKLFNVSYIASIMYLAIIMGIQICFYGSWELEKLKYFGL